MKTKPLGIVVQARMKSSRLPGKVLMPFYEGCSILEIIISKVRFGLPNDSLVIATSDTAPDDVIEDLCNQMGVDVFRGSEHDVLQRFIDVGVSNKFTSMVRVCADNPFLNIENLIGLVDFGYNNPDVDYISYQNHKGIPSIRTHWGVFAEVVKLDALKRVADLTDELFAHEHVTNFIYSNPEMFTIELLNAPAPIFAREDVRFTIDTTEDFTTIQQLYLTAHRFNFHNSLAELIQYVDSEPAIVAAMKKQIAAIAK